MFEAYPLHSQLHELHLPENLLVTGVAFYNYLQGIITTQDTTVYRITMDGFNNPLITEVNLTHLNEKSSNVHYHQPFWVNDSTFGFVKTFYNPETAIGRRDVLISYDNGNSFRSIYQIDEHYKIGRIIAQNDTILYFGITSDIFNSINIFRYVHCPEKVNFKNAYFSGYIYPVFAVVDDDIVVISSVTDSIYCYDFKSDYLLPIKTNLDVSNFALFYELSRGQNSELLGIRSDGIYRSLDDGRNWTVTLPDKNFKELDQPRPGTWWATQSDGDKNWLWNSADNGVSWVERFSIDSKFDIVEVVDPDWFWAGSTFIPGKVIYGQYDKLSVLSSAPFIEKQLCLAPNYPNPFNLSTTIQYHLSCSGFVEIDIFDIQGQLIRNLFKKEQSIGDYEIIWHGDDQNGYPTASGLYILKIYFNNSEIQTRKIMLLK